MHEDTAGTGGRGAAAGGDNDGVRPSKDGTPAGQSSSSRAGRASAGREGDPVEHDLATVGTDRVSVPVDPDAVGGGGGGAAGSAAGDVAMPVGEVTPALEPGVTRLTVPDEHPAALHRLVVDELGRRRAPALWLDSRNRASTYALYEVAGEQDRLLEHLQIARAFTAYQHHELVRRAVRRAAPETGLVVAPRVAALYRDDDVPGGDARAMLRSTMATLGELAGACDLSVLVTVGDPGRGEADPGGRLAGIVADAVDQEVTCEATPMGPRFDAPGFEPRGYWRQGYWQTTIPYWAELLGTVPTMPRPRSRAGDPSLAAATGLDATLLEAGVA